MQPICCKGNGNVTDAEHCCKKECHLGQCGPCDGITKIKCRCGSSTKVNFHVLHVYHKNCENFKATCIVKCQLFVF